MNVQEEMKLVEIDTKEKTKDGITEETQVFKYKAGDDIELKVKGTLTVSQLGLPDQLGDMVLVEFGATNKQTKIEVETKKTKK